MIMHPCIHVSPWVVLVTTLQTKPRCQEIGRVVMISEGCYKIPTEIGNFLVYSYVLKIDFIVACHQASRAQTQTNTLITIKKNMHNETLLVFYQPKYFQIYSPSQIFQFSRVVWSHPILYRFANVQPVTSIFILANSNSSCTYHSNRQREAKP